MMTSTIMALAEATDADLVGESLAGSRDAFGRIVARYQSLICALTYSAIGRLGQSEDVAQETFITAWTHLRHLRDPARLRSWLCGIARNRIHNALRREGRDPLCAAEPLDAAHEVPAAEALPVDQVLNQEEEAILWRSLQRMPETYREPLVLFYREHHSIQRVAEHLELSEDAVKQRLSRGRKLLHEQVLAFVEGALERTNPGAAFTLGVVAALPAFALPAKGVTLGAATVMAQGPSAAKGVGFLGAIGVATTALGAVTGGLFAVRGRIQNARSDRERKFLARASWGIMAWKVLVLVVLLLAVSITGGVIINNATQALSWSLGWVGLYGVWVAYSIWMTARQRKIQIEDGTIDAEVARQHGMIDHRREGFRAIVYGGLAGMIFGPGGLLLMVVGASGDTWVFSLLSLLAIAGWLAGARAAIRRPERLRAIFAMAWWGLALVTLATFNLRFHAWANSPGTLWPDDPYSFHLPPLWLNLPILAFYGSIGLGLWLQRRFAKFPGVK